MWTREDFQTKICEEGFRNDYYRFDLILPRKLLGNGRKFNIFNRDATDYDSGWLRVDCKIPLEHVEGAMIAETNGDHVIVAFIVPVEELRSFVDDLWEELKDFEYDVGVVSFEGEKGE